MNEEFMKKNCNRKRLQDRNKLSQRGRKSSWYHIRKI